MRSPPGVSSAREVFESIRKTVRVFADPQGRELFDLPRAPRPDEDADVPVRYLPEYDNLLLAFDDRQRVIATAHRKYVITRNLIIPATFLVDGMVAGTWKLEKKKREARLVLTPFAPLARPARQALLAEGERLRAFLEPALSGIVDIAAPLS